MECDCLNLSVSHFAVNNRDRRRRRRANRIRPSIHRPDVAGGGGGGVASAREAAPNDSKIVAKDSTVITLQCITNDTSFGGQPGSQAARRYNSWCHTRRGRTTISKGRSGFRLSYNKGKGVLVKCRRHRIHPQPLAWHGMRLLHLGQTPLSLRQVDHFLHPQSNKQTRGSPRLHCSSGSCPRKGEERDHLQIFQEMVKCKIPFEEHGTSARNRDARALPSIFSFCNTHSTHELLILRLCGAPRQESAGSSMRRVLYKT